MNKKFSTLVAALLASGGLFYAVDAMILPAGDGVAKTFVAAVANTDTDGTVVGYKIKTGTYLTSGQDIWKLEAVSGEPDSYYLTTGTTAFYLNPSFELKSTAEGAMKFTLDGSYLKSAGKYLAITEGKLALGEKANALALFTAAATVEVPTTGTGYILGTAVAGVPTMVDLTQTDQSVNWKAATKGLKGNAITDDYAAANNAKVKIVNGTGAASSQLFLQVNGEDVVCLLTTGTDITYGDIPNAKNDASAISISTTSDENQGKVMIGGSKYLKIDESGALSIVSTVGEGNVYATATLAASTTKKEDAVTAGNQLVLYTASNPATPTQGFYLSYAETAPAALTMANIGGNVGTFTSLEEAQKFSTDGSGQLQAGSDFVIWDGTKVTLAAKAGANPFVYTDGTFTADDKTLALTADGVTAVTTLGEEAKALVGFSAASTVLTSGTSQSVVVLAVKNMKATIANLTTESPVVLAEAQMQAENAPGTDIPGMENVPVSSEGVVTPPSTGTIDIPAPVTVQVASSTYLTVNANGEVVETTKPAEAEAWVLQDGYLKNVAAEKAGKEKIWLKQTPAAPQSASLQSRAGGNAYGTLVASTTEATPVEVANDAFKIGQTTLTLTIDQTVAPAADIDEANKANLINGALSNGDVVVLAQGTAYANSKQAYVVEVVETLDGQYQYKFREMGSETDYLNVSQQTVFTSTENKGAGMALMANGQYLTIADDGTPSLGSGKLSTAFYKAEVATEKFSAQYILQERGNQSSFNLSLWDKKDGTSTLIQNPFADADLVPMTWDATNGFKAATGAANYTFLLKKGDNYIVLNADDDDVWGNMGSQVTDGGYKLTTITAATMAKFLKGELTDRKYQPYFTFSYDKNGSGLEKDGSLTAKTPIYQISVGSSSTVAGDYKLVSFEIKTGAQKGVYLTVDKAGKHKVYAEFSASNLITGDMNKDYNPLKMKYVNIMFANHPSIRDAKDSKIVLSGRVLSAEADRSAAADEILASKPEGQWVVSMTDANLANALSKDGAAVADNKKFTFTNRESGETYNATSIYYLGNNKYAVASSDKIAATPATRDTMIIEPIDATLKNNAIQMDGYAVLKNADVQDEQFRLLVAAAEEDYYVGENHTAKSHFLGISHDESAAVNWRIVPLTAARTADKDGLLTQASDSVYVINHPQYYNADKKKYFAYSDTIAIISYALQNTANGEYLTYETPQTTTIQSMICNPDFTSYKTTKNVSDAYRFVLKQKAGELYNIVSVDGSEVSYTDGYLDNTNKPYFELGTNKLYGAITLTKQGAVEVDGMYDRMNSNDLFKVQNVSAPDYRLMSQGDTIRIFREENEYDVMYEKGEFLNLGNKAQLTTMAPALYVDTAYVKRGTNSRYQYLLVVEPEYKAATFDNANHQLTPDTTYGRFLVNLIDSAVVAYKNGAIHTNKYINDSEADEVFTKLGFVWGYRTADKLYLTEGQNFKKVKEEIDLSTRDFNIAKFAFRYVNPTNADDKSFKIQTRYVDYESAISSSKKDWSESNEGYLKTINGVVVVADKYAKGEEFNLAAEHSIPTANEGINTSEVSVIASEGEVTINGAAGKTVVITNVLGQTIANTVLSSDNATISAPAGIVVVAVEGEAAVKAIVK